MQERGLRESYTHQVRVQALYCKACGSVSEHGLFARKPCGAREILAPKTPLLCVCNACGALQVFASQEFSSWALRPADEVVCKVLGRGQLLAGDWIYVPGRPRPGRVKALFRTPAQENVVIAYADGAEERVSRTLQGASLPGDKWAGYRLLPFEVGRTALGDAVYHVQREAFGVAVGMLFARESKLVVQLEDGSLLLIALPPQAQIADNATMAAKVLERCGERFGTLPSSVSLHAAQGLVYMLGSLPDLASARALREFCQGMDGARAVVDEIRIEPSETLSDLELEQRVHELLVSRGIPLVRSRLHCKDGCLRLEGVYRHESLPAELHTLLETQPLRGLELDLTCRPQEDPADKSRSFAVNEALRKHARLRGERIRATSLDGVVLLEGIVSSSLQKSQATLAAMIAGRHLRVENHIRVVRPAMN